MSDYNGQLSGQQLDSAVLNTRKIAGIDLKDDVSASELRNALNVENGANKTTVDSSLSSSSTNPVQNKKVYEALQGKYNVQTNGIPKSDLASDVKESLSKADSSAASADLIAEQNIRKALDASIIDNGAKNLSKTNNGSNTSGSWFQFPLVLSPGDYVIYIENLASTDTDASTCQIGIFASDNTNALSNYPLLNRGNDIVQSVTVNKTSAYMRVYCSSSSSLGAGDTVTVTNLMICRKEDWDTSSKYVPYCPTLAELYGMVKLLQQ